MGIGSIKILSPTAQSFQHSLTDIDNTHSNSNFNSHSHSHHNLHLIPWLIFLITPRSRKQKSVLVFLCILTIQFIIYSIYSKSTISSTFKKITDLSQTPDDFHYNHLVDSFHSQDFISRDINYKIQLYYISLYQYNPDWSITSLSNMKFHSKLVSNDITFKQYYQSKCHAEWERLNVQDKEERKKICSVIRSQILSNWIENHKIQEEIFNSVGHLKMFNKFLTTTITTTTTTTTTTNSNDNKNNDEHDLYEQFPDLETRLFPFLTGDTPIYHHNHKTANMMPHQSKKDLDSSIDHAKLIKYLMSNYHGKGIVLTLQNPSSTQLSKIEKLLNLLDFLKNELPVQIVYNSNQLTDGQQMINHLRETYPQLYLVDVSPCIKSQYEKYFNNSFFKIIASIFNSFEQMIFIDIDTVIFQNPSVFLELQQYQSSGAFFYKDRNFQNNGLSSTMLDFYQKLFPSQDFDTKFFEIPPVTNELQILDSNFFQAKSKHMIDSGLFVINKKTHLGGLLTSCHLAIWPMTSSMLYLEKELFWLGQVIVGNEVEFSKNSAAASGELVPYNNNNDHPTHQICSSQLTHVSDDNNGDEILWIKDGLSRCNRFNSLESDLTKSTYKGQFKSQQELREYYEQPISLKAFILPADDLRELPNSDHQPIKSWEFNPDLGCDNTMFCTFERFGPLAVKDEEGTNDENNHDGVQNKVVVFDEEKQSKYQKIIDIWMKQ